MWPVPESPAFLLAKHRYNSAKRSLLWLRGKHEDVSGNNDALELRYLLIFQYSDELEKMQAKAKDPTVFEAPDNSSRLNILRDIKPITICVLMMIFQQLSGINAVMFYSVSIFSDSGSWSPYVSTIILGIVNIFATIFSNSLIDLVGRYQTKCLNF